MESDDVKSTTTGSSGDSNSEVSLPEVRWPKGNDNLELRRRIGQDLDKILNGKMMSIDPGSKAAGWAMFEKGVCVDSGVVKASSSMPIHRRLSVLYDKFVGVAGDPDVMAVERLRGQMSHAYLFWAVGIAVTAARAPVMLEVPINVWKAFAGKDHEKSDKNDAKAIGETVIQIAKEIELEKANQKGRKDL